jgi:hypothetical protein
MSKKIKVLIASAYAGSGNISGGQFFEEQLKRTAD